MSSAEPITQDTIKELTPQLPWFRGLAEDLDTLYTPGLYQLKPSTPGNPANIWGFVRVTNCADMYLQEVTQLDGSQKYFRSINGSRTKPYPAWNRILTEKVT